LIPRSAPSTIGAALSRNQELPMSTRMSHLLVSMSLMLAIAAPASAAPELPNPRPVLVGGTPALNLDGVKAGGVLDVDFPYASSDVVSEPTGASYFVKKHIGTIKYSDVSMRIGGGSRALIDWIAATLQMNYQRKNGGLVVGDKEHQFFNALLTEVGFPALERSNAGKAGLTLKFAPEYTRVVKASGKASKADAAPSMLSTGMFLIEIDGLAAAKIVRMDGFTVKATATQDEIGDARDYLKEPGKLEFPNLTFYIPPADAETFADWHEDFVINGNCGEDKEKSGRIVYFDAQKNQAIEVALFNLGIFAMDDVTVGNQQLRKIDMYVERMEIKQAGKGLEGAGAPAAPTKPGNASARKSAPKAPTKIVGKRKPLPGNPSFGKVPKQ
jgi:hypothetical protein